MEDPPASTAGILAGTGMPVYCSQLLEVASSAWLATALSWGSPCPVAYSSTAALEEHQASWDPPRGFCQPPHCSLECCQALLVLCHSPPSAKTSSLCEPCSLQASPSDVCSPPPPPAPTPYGWAARDHFSSTLPLLFLPGQAWF